MAPRALPDSQECLKRAPKGTQEAPRGAQEASKRPPRDPQEAPRGSPRHPRRSKRTPGPPGGAQGRSQRDPSSGFCPLP
eukprot:1411864-Pyramimonas_sp.AAC.1